MVPCVRFNVLGRRKSSLCRQTLSNTEDNVPTHQNPGSAMFEGLFLLELTHHGRKNCPLSPLPWSAPKFVSAVKNTAQAV